MEIKKVLENSKLMAKDWIKWDKKCLVYFFIRAIALVVQPLITAFIPKAMIDCIEQGVTLERLIIVIALLSILVAITTWLAPFLNELISGGSKIIRMRYAVMAFKKNMYTDYINVESLEGREKNKNASGFYNYSNPYGEFINVCNSLAVSLIGLISSLVLIYKVNITMILLILATCIAELALIRYINKKEIESSKVISSFWVKLDYFYKLAKDSTASKDISVYGFGDRFIIVIAYFLNEIDKINSKFLKQTLAVSGSRAFLNLIRELIAYAYLVYLVYDNRLGVSDFIFYFGIIIGFSNWVVEMMCSYSRLELCCERFELFRDYIESDDGITESKPEANFNEVNSVEFRDVCFSYPGAEKDTIKGMSFKVNAGENIAIVGENGAGKTTAIKLLCGLYYPTNGDILINGVSSRDFSREDYFELFSPVFQDYTFLPMSIAENVCASTDYDEERLNAAFKKAGIYDKINSLDKKEKSMMIKDVYPDAVDFSGGEKQKLLLSKAVYKDAEILILDEPTAALDPIAENELYLKYNELTENKISFFISHRLSSTRFCNRILFISDGKIAECGTHDELMALRGAYYRMYQMQSYYYKENGGVTV